MKNYFIVLVASLFLASCAKEEVVTPETKVELTVVNSLADYESTIKSGVTLVFFHATWCSICKAQRPNITGLLSIQSLNKVKFIEVDKDKNKAILDKYPASSQPVMVIYKDNIERERFSGIHSTEHMKELLTKWNK